MTNSIPNDFSFAISDDEALEAVREFARACEEYSASSLSSAHAGTPREEFKAATLATFEDHQAAIDDQNYRAAIEKEGTPPDFLPGWEEDLIAGTRFNLAYQRGVRLQESRARVRARVRARTHHFRTQTRVRVRARRFPASQRRATSDSGGNDAGGDPEPPHRPTPRVGGAL